MRTPPILDAKEKASVLKEIVEKNPPYGAKVEYELLEAGNGWSAKEF